MARGRRLIGWAGVVGALGLGAAMLAPVVGAWDYAVSTMSYSATGMPSASNPGTQSSQVMAGQYVYDTATMNESHQGYYVLPGTVTFDLYQGDTQYNTWCSSGAEGGVPANITPVFMATVPVASEESTGSLTETVSSLAAAQGAYPVPTTTAVGSTYFWIATYNSNQPNNGPAIVDHSGCSSEELWVVAPPSPPPSVNTTPTPTTAVEGQPLTDSATVVNAVDTWPAGASGTPWIQFWLNGPNDPTCQASTAIFRSGEIPYWSNTGTVHFTVSSKYTVTAPPTTQPNKVWNEWNPSWDMTPGTYRWVVDYYYADAQAPGGMVTLEGGCNQEEVTVGAPTITTTSSPSVGPVTGTFSDSAMVTNVPDTTPTPTVTFNLYQGTSCSTAPYYTSPAETITQGMAKSPAVTLPASGPYEWQATLNDGSTPALMSACQSEQVAAAGTPSITTVPSAGGVVGTSLSDTATITGLYYDPAMSEPTPADTVGFALYLQPAGATGPACTAANLVDNLGTGTLGAPAMTNGVETWTVTSPGTGYAPTAAGTYYWGVTFTATNDAYNNSTMTCGEPVTITPSGGVLGAHTTGQGSGGVLGASTPNTGADLFLPAVLAGLAVLLGGLMLVVGSTMRRRSIA